jgi:hypothetical protein
MAEQHLNSTGKYRINLVGVRSGRLVVLRHEGNVLHSSGSRVFWLCRCDCGNEKMARGDEIRGRTIKSCGCIGREHIIAVGHANRGRVHTPEHAAKVVRAKALNPTRYWLGKKRPPETIAKARQTHISRGHFVGRNNPMYVDGGTVKECGQCGATFTVATSTKDRRRFCSLKCKGDWMSINLRTSSRPARVRTTREYRRWRKTVLSRDNFTCQICGISRASNVDVILHADHIKPLMTHPELIHDLSNGRCLCRPCHYSLPTHGGRGRRWPKFVAA